MKVLLCLCWSLSLTFFWVYSPLWGENPPKGGIREKTWGMLHCLDWPERDVEVVGTSNQERPHMNYRLASALA